MNRYWQDAVARGQKSEQRVQRFIADVEWSEYARSFFDRVRVHAVRVHGEFYALPSSQYQNACACFEITPEQALMLRSELRGLARTNRQDSIAWSVATKTEFLVQEPK